MTEESSILLFSQLVLTKVTTLGDLDLSNSSIDDQRAITLSQILHIACSSPPPSSYYPSSSSSPPIVVRHLDLRSNRIAYRGAVALAHTLATNTTIRILELQRNDIRHQGAVALALALEVNSTLEELDLGENNVREQGVVTLCQALNLRNATLRVLRLDRNNIGNQGAEAIGRALEGKAKFEVLSVGWNGIQDKGAIALYRALGRNVTLRELSLEGNSIGHHGVAALARGLEMNSTLEKLHLCVNHRGIELLKKAHFFTQSIGDVLSNGQDTPVDKKLLMSNKSLWFWGWKVQSVIKDDTDRLPLHHAINKSMGWMDGLKHITEANYSALGHMDNETDMYPFMMAAAVPRSDLNAVYELLRANPKLLLWLHFVQ